MRKYYFCSNLLIQNMSLNISSVTCDMCDECGMAHATSAVQIKQPCILAINCMRLSTFRKAIHIDTTLLWRTWTDWRANQGIWVSVLLPEHLVLIDIPPRPLNHPCNPAVLFETFWRMSVALHYLDEPWSAATEHKAGVSALTASYIATFAGYPASGHKIWHHWKVWF